MAEIRKECSVTTADKVGKLAEITDKVKAAGVNIIALCAWTEGGTGRLVMVAEDAAKACDAIQPVVDKCEWGEAVCVKVANKPGALEEVAKKLADAGVGIEMCYATAPKGESATIVLHTTDNAKAVKVL